MDDDPIPVELPNVAFTQAFINLLENAREAQEEVAAPDPLEVEVRRVGEFGVVAIRDRGPGLPSEGDRVGEPFFTTKATGTGLGVFVARALADGAGGGLDYVRVDDRTIARWYFPETPSVRP
jgi:C4-dicarboxylate-specific signal transduction histidine kinase